MHRSLSNNFRKEKAKDANLNTFLLTFWSKESCQISVVLARKVTYVIMVDVLVCSLAREQGDNGLTS